MSEFDPTDPNIPDTEPTERTEVLVVDSSVADYQRLLAGLDPDTEVIRLSGDGPGIEDLATILAGRSGIDALHIVSHGSSGAVHLGDDVLSADTLDDHAAALAAISGSLSEDADLLIYGCRVGDGEAGLDFVEKLALATGADVAASNDATGHADPGGDWQLEIVSGSIETAQPFSESALRDFSGLLALPADNTTFDFNSGWTDAGNTLTHNYFTVAGNDTTSGVTDMKMYNSPPNSTAYMLGGAVDSSGIFTVTADGTNVGTFQLTQVVVGDYQADRNFSNVYVKGYLSGGGTVTSTTKNGTDNVLDTFTFSGGDMSSFVGQDLTSFKVFFSEDDSFNWNTANFEFRSFTTTAAAAPAADPTITSATYDAATGSLVVTGTNFSASAGADVIANKITLTGEGGSTYTLTDTANVEITSATAFTLTLSATDRAAVNQMINQDGTSSSGGTAYDVDGAAGFIAASAGISDTGVNPVTVSNVTDPAITSATYDYNANLLVVTGTDFVHKSGAANDVDLSLLTLTGEGGATYTLTTATDVEITSGTQFSVTLAGADIPGVETLLNNNGTTSATAGTTYNLAAADNWMAGATAVNNIADATGGVTVSNYAVPTVTSATYDYATGQLVVTGTDFVTQSGASNDVDISRLTFTGEGGATYTLTSASDVEVTSATSYTVTLSGADLTHVEGLLNNNGTTSATSGTTYNLASAEDWMAGAPAASTVADAAAAITVSNYAGPTITSAAYDYNANQLVVTGTNFVSQPGGANDVDLPLLTVTGEAGATYTLTSATDVDIDSATQFTVTLSGADLINVESLLNKDGTLSADVSSYLLAAADNWMTQSPAAADISDSLNTITVSNYAVPTITSATYDFSTGSLAVTGTNLVAASGAGNDIDASLLTLRGDGGATHTLTDTADVDITSATEFTLTLSATDKLAVGGLLNKDGTLSDDITTYNLAAADNWITGAPAANNVADLTGNGITVSNVAVPALTSAAYDYNTNQLVVTGTNFVNESGATNDVDISRLTFTGEGGATYTLTSASDVEVTSATSFSLTLAGSDLYNVERLLNKDGSSAVSGATYNLAAADNWMAGAAATPDIADATNGITVSNVAAPTVTSAAYDVSTGQLAVTGTNLVNQSGATNDVDASLLTVTGDGGTYTLTDTADVELTSATSFTVSLSATDQLNVNGLLNKDGTVSGGAVTYNLAAADNWLPGSPAATDIADLTGNAITVSNVATPTVTSATYDSDTGVLAVTGTNLFRKSGATNDVDISTLTLTGGTGNQTYTITSATDVEITSATAFAVTLIGADKTNVDALLDQVGTVSFNGSTYNLAAADNWLAGADAAPDISDATNAVTVSVSPKITSATYNATTGALVVTGTNIQANGGGADIDASMFTLTGEGGSTYTLTDTPDVERDSITQFTLSLSATDRAAVNPILNKDGSAATGGTTYNLAAADDWDTNVTAGDTADTTGNAVTVSNVPAPTLTSATYNAATGALVVTGTGFLKAAGVTNDIDVSKLTVTGEGGATYILTDSSDVEITSGTAFTVTLSATDRAAVNQIVNKDGTVSTSGTTYNLAAAEDWAAGADAAVNVVDATGNGITVSAVAAPTLTSATYDAATGTLAVTGTGLLKAAGATNDIDVSKLTFTGEGGATYTLTDSPDVEITSGTAFTAILSATDRAAVNQIVNKNGTSSTGATTYNLAAAEDWAVGADAAVNVADTAGNGITVSNVAAPTITSAAYDYNSNVLTVTGSGLLKAAGATNDIDISKFTVTGEGGATYTLTSASDVEITSGTQFSATLSGADLYNVEALLNQDGVSATDITTYNLGAGEDWAAGADAAVNVADLTGNGVTVSNWAAPALTSATYDWSTGQLAITGTNFVNASGAGNDLDASLLTVTGGGASTYTLTDSPDVEITSATGATVTLSATDQLTVHGLLNRNGTVSGATTTYNLAAADNWLAGSPTAIDISDTTGNAVTVSNVATPTVTSATYNADSGVLQVTGTNLFKKSGAANDVDISTLTLTGEGGAYTVTSASDVEITSATSFSVTLSGADKTSVDLLLDQVGTTSSGGTTYNLAAADNWLAGADAVTDISDATNAVTVSVNPRITAATYNAATGVLVVTGTNIQANSGGLDIDASTFTVTGEGGETYTLTDTADVERDSITQFTLTLSATDRAAVNPILNKDGSAATGGTTYNLAAADNWNTNITAGDTADTTGNAVTVSNVAVPTLTSATYNAATGTLVAAGTGFLKAAGANNDVDVSKLTFTGEGGATYTLTDSSDVEITSGTAFTVTLSAADKAAVNPILNKDGVSSTSATTYNLAAAEDWAAGAASAVAVADTTGNAVTVSNVAVPTITSAAYNTASGILTVTGTGLLQASGANNDIDVSKLTITGQGGSTYTLTSSSVEITDGTSFSVTLNGTDKNAVNTLLNNNGTSASDATVYNLAAAEDWAAGADAAVTVADLTGNGITNTVYVPPPPDPDPDPDPEIQQVDGTRVTTVVTENDDGSTTTTARVSIVTPSRVEDTSTANSGLADIPLATDSRGEIVLAVGLPVGAALISEAVTGGGTNSLRELLIAAADPKVSDSTAFSQILAGIDSYVPTVGDEDQVVVRTITLSAIVAVPEHPIVITGASGANGQEAVVIDVRNLPSGAVIHLNNVEFAIIIGAGQFTGGNGSNYVIGDDAAQFIVLGADDDELHGGGGNDTIGSKGGDDRLFGDDGNDIVYGGDDNDMLDGGAGQDFIAGGRDDDTAIFSGTRDQYRVTHEYGKTTVVSLDDPDDIDTLINVETIAFADESLSVTHTVEESMIATLYQQILGRQADLDGFQYWAHAAANGMPDGDIALNFLRSEENQQATGLVFDDLSAADQIEFLYTEMLGRPSDAAGKDYWVDQLENGSRIEDIAYNFVNCVELLGQYVSPEGWDFFI